MIPTGNITTQEYESDMVIYESADGKIHKVPIEQILMQDSENIITDLGLTTTAIFSRTDSRMVNDTAAQLVIVALKESLDAAYAENEQLKERIVQLEKALTDEESELRSPLFPQPAWN